MSLVQVEDVWGVGLRISKKLNAIGIETALHLAESSAWTIRKNFNVVLERTIRELRGEPCLELEEFAPTKQQIVCSRSFGGRITEYEDMRQAVCSYAERASEKLCGKKQNCRQISVFVRTSPHTPGGTPGLIGPFDCASFFKPSDHLKYLHRFDFIDFRPPIIGNMSSLNMWDSSSA